MAGEPASRKARTWALACGVLVGLFLALAGQQAVTYTSTDAFCDQACHSHPHATEMWVQSAHYANKRGVIVHCTDCHLPPGGIEFLTEKARLGAHDVLAQAFQDVSKIDWSRKRQLDRARTFSYDAACAHCHSNLFTAGLSSVAGTLPAAPQQTSPEQVREMRIVARRMEAHLYYQRNREKLRCLNCHLFEGHRLPKQTLSRTAIAESAQFPLAVSGFQNYTEAVTGSEVKFPMIAVSGGTLESGSPTLGACRQRDAGLVQTVNVGPFWMARATVSRRELDSFLARRKERTSPSGRLQTSAPEVTADLAAAYVSWLSQATGKSYRLPTEVELEYACIANGTMPAWAQSESRAVPDASADVADLNAWGFMDLPDSAVELTSDNSQSAKKSSPSLGATGVRFRVVRVPEGNRPTESASADVRLHEALSSSAGIERRGSK